MCCIAAVTFGVVNRKTMHISFHSGKRQMNAFLYPVGSLFNSLLSFDEMSY